MRHLDTYRHLIAIAHAGSIRAAADEFAITSTALNRRILALEDELGTVIFERLPRGVRPTAGGEVVLAHARAQLEEAERLRSRLEDLSGARRGHVAVACAHQALLRDVLPRTISRYRDVHPGVAFTVQECDPVEAAALLSERRVDLAVVFEPQAMPQVEPVSTILEPIRAAFAVDHPLATETGPVRLRDCVRHPLVLPVMSYGVRRLLEKAALRAGLRLEPTVESNSYELLRAAALTHGAVTFEIATGQGPETAGERVTRPLSTRDAPPGLLFVGRLRDRALPVAAAAFAELLVDALSAQG